MLARCVLSPRIVVTATIGTRWTLRFARHSSSAAAAPLEPLRILFCGSDGFSMASLQRLHQEHRANPGLIASLDVVCRPGKRAGRGFKRIQHPRIKALAEQLGLPLHQIDSFTGWTPPTPFNLVLAVSFGLLVPPRILAHAAYGGLNLHPSMLPDLRGPTPLHHALLLGRASSGITLQTLHPRHFDRGLIIDQRPFDLPNNGLCTFDTLLDHVSPLAADVLVDNLRAGTFRRPDLEQRHRVLMAGVDHDALVHAPKISSADSRIDWSAHSSVHILRAQRAFGSLWSHHPAKKSPSDPLVVKWFGLMQVDPEALPCAIEDFAPGDVHAIRVSADRPILGDRLLLRTVDGALLEPTAVTVEGKPKESPPVAALHHILHSFQIPDQATTES